DGVTDIVSLAPADITPVAGLGAVEAGYLLGVGVVDGRRLILVDIDSLMAIRLPGPHSSPMQAA
ncbi:MAG: hypothetical protein RLZZ237_1863, partial [Pseudomonadota bacterium]